MSGSDRDRRQNLKRAAVSQHVEPAKNPRYVESPREDDSRRVRWRFGDADLNGRWQWTAVHIAHDALRILAFLAEVDRTTWAIGQQGYRPRLKRVEASGICAEAQDCLRRLRREPEYLYEWRMSGAERIWGERDGDIFQVIWWDPDHTVWPSEPD